jgi:uncharacterized protein YbjT (DUF2867 family)
LSILIRFVRPFTLDLVTNSPATTLVLGGTGKTGSRLATNLAKLGLEVRTAARNGADVHFDWYDADTHQAALQDVERLYLVPPVMRTDFADLVATFLDLAEASGVRHVTYLSGYGIEQVSPDEALRAVELDLIARSGITHSFLRPAWFMQNFSEGFLYPRDGVIALPTGAGTEAFVSCDDIAAVGAATLANPDAHSGAAYAITGPEAITVGEAAEVIAGVSGKPVIHLDLEREAWVEAMIGAGVPADYASKLRTLTEVIASGAGARPSDDVERVTGSRPTTFAEFAERTQQAWI